MICYHAFLLVIHCPKFSLNQWWNCNLEKWTCWKSHRKETIDSEFKVRSTESKPVFQFSSALPLSRVQLFATPWTAVCQASLSITNSWSLLKTHVHQVGDAIQPSHPLLSPSPPAPNPSQHQGLFQWVSSSHQVATILEFQLQYHSFQWTSRTDLL